MHSSIYRSLFANAHENEGRGTEGTSLLLLESAGESNVTQGAGQQPRTRGQGHPHGWLAATPPSRGGCLSAPGFAQLQNQVDNNILQNILSSTELITIISNNVLPMHLALLLENSAKGLHLPQPSSC